MESPRRHLNDNSINGLVVVVVAYMKRVMYENPLLLHNEICAAAENLRWKYGITNVSINPWFYLTPPKSRRDRRHFHGDLWKLYAVSGEDTDSDEGDDREIVSQTPKLAIVPELPSPQKKSSAKYVSTSDEVRTSPPSAKTGIQNEVPKKSSEITINEIDPTKASKKKIRKKKSKTGKSKLPNENFPIVNCAKEREEKLISLYGPKAFHIKAMEDWLEVMQKNYITKFNPVYWPCVPLNFEYALDKPTKTQN